MEAYIFRKKAPLAAALPPGQLVKASELWSRCLNTLWARIFRSVSSRSLASRCSGIYTRASPYREGPTCPKTTTEFFYVGKVQPEAHRHFVVRRLFLVRMYASWLFFKGQLTDIRCSFSLVTLYVSSRVCPVGGTFLLLGRFCIVLYF